MERHKLGTDTSVLNSSGHLLIHRGGCRSVCTPHSVSGETKPTNEMGPANTRCFTYTKLRSCSGACVVCKLGTADGLAMVKTRTYSVYRVLVNPIEPQPSGQLGVFLPLSRLTPLSHWAT